MISCRNLVIFCTLLILSGGLFGFFLFQTLSYNGDECRLNDSFCRFNLQNKNEYNNVLLANEAHSTQETTAKEMENSNGYPDESLTTQSQRNYSYPKLHFIYTYHNNRDYAEKDVGNQYDRPNKDETETEYSNLDRSTTPMPTQRLSNDANSYTDDSTTVVNKKDPEDRNPREEQEKVHLKKSRTSGLDIEISDLEFMELSGKYANKLQADDTLNSDKINTGSQPSLQDSNVEDLNIHNQHLFKDCRHFINPQNMKAYSFYLSSGKYPYKRLNIDDTRFYVSSFIDNNCFREECPSSQPSSNTNQNKKIVDDRCCEPFLIDFDLCNKHTKYNYLLRRARNNAGIDNQEENKELGMLNGYLQGKINQKSILTKACLNNAKTNKKQCLVQLLEEKIEEYHKTLDYAKQQIN